MTENGCTFTSTYTFNSGESEYIAFYGNRYQDAKATWIQLEEGTVATPYEPHIKSNLQLTNDLSSLIALLKSKNVI